MIAGENEVLVYDETVRCFVEEGFLRGNHETEIVDEVADDAEMRGSTSTNSIEKEAKQQGRNGPIGVERCVGRNGEPARFKLVENR